MNNTPESIIASKSKNIAARCNFQTLKVLNESEEGYMHRSEIQKRIEEVLHFDEWELYVYPTRNQPRWIVEWHYYSGDLVKASFLIKRQGVWYITPEGRQATKDYTTPDALIKKTDQAYSEWEKKKEFDSVSSSTSLDIPKEVILEDTKQQANDDMRNYLCERTAYEFQDMVASLLRAMGYYTPFVAPKGKDGGVDVIAYKDPLGATKPVLKVQVKHYNANNPVSVDVVHSIMGVAHNDTPVVVTSGVFTSQAVIEARNNNVRLIDGAEFVDLWIEYYGKMSEDDKALMPIEPVYFIKRSE